MSSSRFKRPAEPREGPALTPAKPEEWLASLDSPAANASMIDGYLADLAVPPQFIPPEEWRLASLGRKIADAPDGSVRSTGFQRYSQIGSTLSG